MTNPERAWISPQAYERLQKELATLRELYSAAVAHGDTDDNSAAIQRARIQRIHRLLVNALVGEEPPDDGIAEPGMVLTVRYDDIGDTETFLLGARGVEYGDMEVYSIQSPLGAAMEGARPGERRAYTPPSGDTLTATLLRSVPYGIHMAGVT